MPAVVLAIVAIVVSVAVAIPQAVQSHRQSKRDAIIQHRFVVLEEARRGDELLPRVKLRYREDPDSAEERLEWVHDGPQDLDDVSFTLVEGSGAGWQPLIGVRFIREGLTLDQGSLGPMSIGTAIAHGLVRTPGSERDGGEARFRMHCTKGSDSWEFAVGCKIPPFR